MTRAAATRNQRSTIPRLTEIHSPLPPQPANVPVEAASPDATGKLRPANLQIIPLSNPLDLVPKAVLPAAR